MLLKKSLPRDYYLLFFLVCCVFIQLITLIPPVQAEGSRELNQSGSRSFLLYASDSEAGIAYQNTIKVFVNTGEQVNIGSSVYKSYVDSGDTDIVYIAPDGTTGSCNVEDPTSATNPNKPLGLIRTLADESNGPEDPNDSSTDPPGYTPCKFTATATGIYKIIFHPPVDGPTTSTSNIPTARPANEEFLVDSTAHDNQKVGIAAWDVTVFKATDNPSTKQVGRVYANYLPLSVPTRTSPQPIVNGAINPELFILSKVGHVYNIKLNGIQPGKFIFFANNKGFRDSNEDSLLQSVLQAGASIHNPGSPDDTSNITYKIFFNPPFLGESNVPPTAATSPSDSTWLHADPPFPPNVTDFTFTGSEGTLNQAGTTNPHGGTFSFNTNRIGNYILTIDANKNNKYGDVNDRVIIGRAATVNPNTIDWSDGQDGNGTLLEIGTYKVKLLLSTDEVHFPFLDVEKNPNGLIIQRLGSNCGNECYTVYYDDSNVDGEKKLDGEDSTNGAHQFTTPPTAGFGDNKGIDTWTSITAEPPGPPLEINIKEVDLEVTKTHSPNNPSPGSTVTYTITVKSNDGTFSDVTGIGVKDIVPSEISGINWTCTVDHTESGNRCAQLNGTGNNIDTTVDLTPGTIATFTVNGSISGSLASGQKIENTVTITTPNDVTNNSSDPSDPSGKTKEANDTINLVDPPSKLPPTANNDSASTLANTPVTIPVLNNDSDDNSPLLKISSVTTPKNGGITQILTDGTIKYTPRAGFSGTDTFEYSVCDADDLCARATVTVNVTSPPSPPPPPPPIVVKKLLSITIEGKGTVTSSPGSINCHSGVGICALGFNIDTSVALNAKPDSGWKFKEWKQDCDDNGEVTLSSDKQCEAIFVQVQQLTLTVFITGQGSVTAITPPGVINCGPDCTNEYAEGTQVVLQATPAADWQLEGWRGHCDEQGEVTLLETNKQCRAIFTPITTPLEPFKVTVYKTGQGTVISEPIGIDCGGTCSAQYDGSQGVQLIATPDPGWKLEGWRGHCDENGQVIRDNSSYNHAQCRVIFLLDPTPEPTPDPDPDNTPITNTDKPDQGNNSNQSDNNSNDQPVDEDHDGVLTTTENAAPNSGDGNNDGIPDSQQNNVISLSTGGQYITVEETQGCQVQTNQPPAATTIDLNLSCSQADLKTYYHGVSDFQNLPSFQSVSTDSNPNLNQTPPITYNTVMIQGQAVAVESVSLSDGGVGDSMADDGQITYTLKLGSSPSHETQPATTDSSDQINPLPSNSPTGSVSTIIGQEIGGFNPSNITSQETTGSPTISRCLLFSSTTTQSSSWNQILQVGDTTTFTLNTGPGELSIKEMPDSSLVSVDHWQSLNGNVELSLTGLSAGDTQMTLSDSASSQQAILHITVIATTNHLVVDTALPLTEKEVKTLQTVIQIGQNIDLAVMGGQGSLTITQLPNSNLVSLTNWQNQTNGIAHFTLTGLDIGNTNLVITDEATPPQKTNVNISILAADNDNLVVEPTIVDDTETCQGDTLGIDLQNRPNQACFIGKVISLGDLRSSAHVFTPTEAQNARVSATVLISPDDVGQAAKILLVGRHTNLNGETNLYIRDDSRDKHSWQKWDGQIEQIPSSQYYPQLPEIIDVFIYEGDLSAMPGEFTVFVGYQLSDGIIIYNGLKPIHFWVGNH